MIYYGTKDRLFLKLLIISLICCLCFAYPPRRPRIQTDGVQGRSGSSASNFIENLREQYVDVLEGRSNNWPHKPQRIPDLSHISKRCPRNTFYFSMNPQHRQAVQELNNILMDAGSTNDYLNFAMDLRNRSEIHPRVWYRALTNYAYNNPDLEGISKPSPVEVMPEIFINSRIWKNVKTRQPYVDKKAVNKPCTILDETAGIQNGIENLLWYFREDIFLNIHHWFHHIANPTSNDIQDRRGELFWYMHQSMLARYNAERFSHGMPKVQPYVPIEGAPIPEPCYTYLEDGFTGKAWSNRPRGTLLSDIEHSQNPGFGISLNIERMHLATSRIITAINNGFIETESGDRIPLNNWRGIDFLGNIVQSSDSGINPDFYGPGPVGLHNDGHIALGFSIDPDYISKAPPGPMSDEATACRDPIFFPWHTYIDNILQRHLRQLYPFEKNGGEFPLGWKGVELSELTVSSAGRVGELETFFEFKKLRLTRGLDFTNEYAETHETVDICVKRLNHKDFSYQFVIEKESFVKTSKATIRIFMSPSFVKGVILAAQRSFFFVLDTFTTTLKVGKNVINRNSTESLLTIPSELSIDELDNFNSTDAPRAYCGCGWPHHLLISKGNADGMQFDIFAMVTNGDEDEVQNMPFAQQEFCESSYLYCGVPGRKYPDAKPMGYPFNRIPCRIFSEESKEWINPTLQQYVEGNLNMAVHKVTVTHTGTLPNTCCNS